MIERIKHLLQERLPELDDDITEYVLNALEDGSAEDVENYLLPLCGDDEETKKLLLQEIHQWNNKNDCSNATDDLSERKPIKLKNSLQEASSFLLQQHSSDNEKGKTLTTPPGHRKKRSTKQSNQPQHQETISAFTENTSSAWKKTLVEEEACGGRGKGGRGEYAGAVNSVKSNIHLSDVSISLDNGIDLLRNSTMDIVRGHRYGYVQSALVKGLLSLREFFMDLTNCLFALLLLRK